MNKENILYGIIGLLIGLIIGYIGTNSLNRSYAPSEAEGDLKNESNNLPANHPPAGGSSDSSTGGAQAEVMAVIQKARDEASNFDAQMQAAGMYRQINRHEQALEFYDRAHKIKPKDFDLLVNLGDTNFDLQRYAEAENWYLQALKIKPNNVTVRMDLGLTYFLRQPRDLDKAILEYKQALKIDPGHEKTLQNLTAAFIEKGDKTAARGALKQLEQVNPNNQAIPQFRDRLKE